MLLLCKHICTCCSCMKLELFWYNKVTSIWRTWLEPAWGCIPPKQRQRAPQPTWEAQEVTGLGMRSTRFPSCPLPCLAGSRQSGQIMAQGWFTECPLREGPPRAGRSGASPTALLESAATPHTCCITSQQNPPSREGKPPRNGPRVRDVTAGTGRHLPALGQPPPLLWCPLPSD